MTAAIVLQKALHETLSSDLPLLGLLGAGKVFDEALPDTRPPYVVFAPVTSSDWSTATEAGEEHGIRIEAWSSRKGRLEVANIASVLRDAVLAIAEIEPPHHLVNLVHTTTTIARDDQSGYYRAIVQFRAVTEPR
ncbi:MAG: DUF3168 domain-containing protein [Nitratireductor sp.]|nr:DUF3168 domain-containing protein [Nitratireductor sp.]